MLLSVVKFLSFAAVSFHHGAVSSPVATLPRGVQVAGLAETSSVGTRINTYLGIPYAEAPIGGKRWKQSKLKPVTTSLNANAYGSSCYNDPSLDAILGTNSSKLKQSEDCLYLNVFTPGEVTSSSRLPVMVWIYGGGFVAGAGDPHPGNNLIGASGQKVVVVNFNYRLGPLGFLSNEGILKEGDGANFGLRDQEVALQWVKKYIQFFGGNPDDVTVFGESAGASSIALHLVSRDGNQQLFHRAILQSGAHFSVQELRTRAVQESQTLTIAKAVGCSGATSGLLACLRKADARALFEAGKGPNWMPTIDKVFTREAPFLRIQKGLVSRVPTVIGVNTDDGWYFSVAGSEASTFDSWIRKRYSLMNDQELVKLAALYPLSAFPTPRHRSSEVFKDATFACPGELISSFQSRTVADAYRYRFNFADTALGQPLALHAEDVNFVFDRPANVKNDSNSRAVVSHIQTFWTTFAIAGSPNGNGTNTTWPRFNERTKKQIVLQPTLKIEADDASMPQHSERCAFWSAFEARVAPHFDQ